MVVVFCGVSESRIRPDDADDDDDDDERRSNAPQGVVWRESQFSLFLLEDFFCLGFWSFFDFLISFFFGKLFKSFSFPPFLL